MSYNDKMNMDYGFNWIDRAEGASEFPQLFQ